MGAADEAFDELLELEGRTLTFDDVDGRGILGDVSVLNMEIQLKQGESHAISVRAYRDTWGGGLPRVGSHLALEGATHRVAGMLDDGLSSTVILALAK